MFQSSYNEALIENMYIGNILRFGELSEQTRCCSTSSNIHGHTNMFQHSIEKQHGTITE